MTLVVPTLLPTQTWPLYFSVPMLAPLPAPAIHNIVRKE